jgi:NTE family protein
MMDISSPAPATTPAKAQRVLVLQGGGALGSYQAGAYQALCRHGFEPEWVAGISIGAINAAIIAGNAPEGRVDKLRGFWEEISAPAMGFHAEVVGFERDKAARTYANQVNAGMVVCAGVPSFFRLRIPSPWFHPRLAPSRRRATMTRGGSKPRSSASWTSTA